MAMHSIQELFEHELKEMYSGEDSLLDALEQMFASECDVAEEMEEEEPARSSRR